MTVTLRRVAFGIALAGVASAAYQTLSEQADRRRFPPLGRLVDVA